MHEKNPLPEKDGTGSMIYLTHDGAPVSTDSSLRLPSEASHKLAPCLTDHDRHILKTVPIPKVHSLSSHNVDHTPSAAHKRSLPAGTARTHAAHAQEGRLRKRLACVFKSSRAHRG
jgi:hypothetical protein